jgi:sulfide:quinone oxidoreductase
MAEIEAAAKAHGLDWVYLPVASGNITDEDVERFAPMIRGAEKPVLAFCRSGTRCTILWALSSAPTLPAPEIIQRARGAGYDLSGLEPRIAQHARKSS